MPSKVLTRGAWALAAVLLPAGLASGQSPAAPNEEARIADGRRVLELGDAARAAQLGRALITQFPRSAASIEFAVEAESASAGPAAALVLYERWLTASLADAPRALHQIARAVLREIAASRADSSTRARALQALADDGDPDAAAALARDALGASGRGALTDAQTTQGIANLAAELQSPMGSDRRRAAMALGSTRNARAVDPLLAALNDPNPDVRAVAAEGLGKLGATRAITPLRNLLTDQVFNVQYQAAVALFALKDSGSLTWLRQLESSPEPGIRLIAVQATASQPDGNWIALVRGLASTGEPDIRRQAAELLAPHDPAAARAALEFLSNDPNVVQRDRSITALVERTETDLRVLRRYLAGTNAVTRVAAAIRLLEITR